MTEELPEDLRRWRALGEDQPFAEHGVRFLADDEPASVFDTSYLTDADRADPNIAANVAAIADTAALITWVAESEDGEVFGYWRGPSDTRLEQAPVVQYDTEGQFSTMPGRTLSYSACVSRESAASEGAGRALVLVESCASAAPANAPNVMIEITSRRIIRIHP